MKQENVRRGSSQHQPKKSHEVLIANPTKYYYVKNKNITLAEDVFGLCSYSDGKIDKIYRYTWTNLNNIQVEVITYGARIRSIKTPNRKGVLDDIVLGFRDLAGYIYFDDTPFGATIGRVTGYVENSTFAIDGKQHWVSANAGNHHFNGGYKGFDKAIFQPYVDGTKVILSHTSPDQNEGYPGDLFLRITFELSPTNEFKINMEAMTTKPTIINLSNLTYFNLAGHYSGPEEIYKHTVTINANCYTMNGKNKFPTGVIQNVYHTKNDFQIPTVLKNCIGISPNDGYDQNLCVNRGIEQEIGFVARALHVPSGRILEVYSNQYGVNFATGNDLGSGFPKMTKPPKSVDEDDNIFEVLDEMHTIIIMCPGLTEDEAFQKIGKLLKKITKIKLEPLENSSVEILKLDTTSETASYEVIGNNIYHVMGALVMKYLLSIQEIAMQVLENFTQETALESVAKIIHIVKKMDDPKVDDFPPTEPDVGDEVMRANHEMLFRYGEMFKESRFKFSKISLTAKGMKAPQDKKEVVNTNIIPDFYKDGRIHGKNGAVYKKHGGICFQTQNYPSAIHHPEFPNTILRPGESYKHTIVYKFYIQSGDPTKWIQRQNSK